jgi:hypothetical protein
VRYWREREGLVRRTPAEIAAAAQRLEGQAPAPATLDDEQALDEAIAQIIRSRSIRYNGLTHQEAMEVLLLFYRPAAGVAGAV